MQSAYNKLKIVGHKGPHGEFYNLYILRKLSEATEGIHDSIKVRAALVEVLMNLRYQFRYGGLDALVKAASQM